MAETSLGGPARVFPETLWSLVLQGRGGLSELAKLYWKPVYFYVRRRGHGPEAAKDLTQDFFATLIERGALDGLERRGAKFRTYLIACLRNFLIDAARARRPAPFSIHAPEDELERDLAGTEPSPEEAFTRKWTLDLLREAWRALESSLRRRGRTRTLDVLKLYMSGTTGYAELARRTGASEQDVTNDLHRIRRGLREALIRTIRPGVGNEREAEEELAELFRDFR